MHLIDYVGLKLRLLLDRQLTPIWVNKKNLHSCCLNEVKTPYFSKKLLHAYYVTLKKVNMYAGKIVDESIKNELGNIGNRVYIKYYVMCYKKAILGRFFT